MDHDPIAEAFEILQEGADIERDIERWRERRRNFEELEAPLVRRSPAPHPQPEPPALSPRERRKFDRWFHREARKDQRPARAAPAFTQTQIEAIGTALAAERQRMREHVAAELANLRAELERLRAESSVANELADLRRQVEILRADRKVLDLSPVTPVKSKGGVG